MEHPLDKTLHLDMVPRTSKTLYVQNEFVISDNLSIRVPPGIAALLEKGRPTRTLRPNWLEFPYRIGFNAILFVETGVVDCILNTETFRITNRSVLLIPSATLLRDLSWQAGTRYILFGYNDGKLFSAMTSRSAKILKASMIAPFVLTMDRERMDRYMHLIKVLIHVASGGPDYDFQDDIINGAAQMFSGGLARLVVERTDHRARVPREMTVTQDFIRLVQARCLEHRDLDYYARELCITPKYLSRIVSKVAGKKALLVIQENVIAEAESLLKAGKYNVQQISDLLHFPSPSYFCRYFRKATGQTPREYMLR
jgi:AraC-like DNA-binding protein